MALYLISYDLPAGASDAGIVSFLNAQQAIQAQRSVWLVQAGGPAGALRDVLADQVPNGSILVLQLQPGSQWGTKNVRSGTSDWLRTNVTP